LWIYSEEIYSLLAIWVVGIFLEGAWEISQRNFSRDRWQIEIKLLH
jgi:hypothetical protein